MLYEYSGVCQKCANEVKILVHETELLASCSECGESPFAVRQKAGVIYVANNSNQTGVKIGLTKKSVHERIRRLSTTGVPGRFKLIAMFPSDRPEKDEKRVHEKLKRARIEKEHFDVSPVEGVLKAHRALGYREPVFFDADVKERFYLEKKMAKLEMKLKMKGKAGK